MAVQNAISQRDAELPVRPPGWVRLGLGIVMILAGSAILADVALAAFVSPTFIGAAAVVVGLFEINHAVRTRGWGALPWQLVLGLLYVAVGVILVWGAANMVVVPGVARSARSGALLLTYGLGLLLAVSGIVRILLGLLHWRRAGWVMTFAGTFGVVAGLIVLAEFPKTGFWIFGLLLGLDLIVHGAAWLGFVFQPRTGMS